MLRSSRLLLLAAFLGCGSDGGSQVAGPSDAGPAPLGSLSSVVAFNEIAIYQAVKVSFVAEGKAAKPNAPVIARRPALVRVHATTNRRTTVPPLSATLRIRSAGREDIVVEDGPRTLTKFEEKELSSGFSFLLEADQVPHGAVFSVELHDPSGADPTVLRYPAEGDLSLNVATFSPKLRVRFVPIKYQADGSDRLPDMEAATIRAYRDALYKLYPVSEVELTVRNELSWPLDVRSNGEGWEQLLGAIIQRRQDDNAADDEYYVGVFVPAPTRAEYCEQGCVLGVAPSPLMAIGVAIRSAMIVGFHSEDSHGTLAQELAHSMGRMHAPCGRPDLVDRKFPYGDASIGTWGWDVLGKELVDPLARFDFMSYCTPVWVSDYTYSAIYEQMADVIATKRPDGRTPMKTYQVDKDGKLRAGPTIRGLPTAFSDEVVVGEAKVRGAFQPYSNISGGIFVTPETIPPAKLRHARFARLPGNR